MDNDKLNNNDTIEQLKRDFTVIRLNEELGLKSYDTEEPRRVYEKYFCTRKEFYRKMEASNVMPPF